MDEANTRDTTDFVRVPSVWWPEMDYTSNPSDSSVDIWQITAGDDKEVEFSTTPGYLYTVTGDVAAERVWTVETRTTTHDTLVYYDCVTKDELADYTLVAADYGTTHPEVEDAFNFYNDIFPQNYQGEGVGYDATVISGTDEAVRGLIFIDGDTPPSPTDGQFITHTYTDDPDTITRVVRTFDLDPYKDGTEESREKYYDDGYDEWWLVKMVMGGAGVAACPQSISPRMWPMAAGFQTTSYVYDAPPAFIENQEATVHPKSTVYSGKMTCSSGSPGDLTFPSSVGANDDWLTKILVEEDGDITGASSNVQALGSRFSLEIMEYDCSPGGYIVLIRLTQKNWTGDLDYDDSSENDTFATSLAYYVYLLIGEHGTDEPSEIQKYTSNSDFDHLWGNMGKGDGTSSMHAIHKHKDDDDYWLFAIPYRIAITTDYYSIRVYKIDAGSVSLYWETPTSINSSDLPQVLWSSDRWIYVRNLRLSAADTYLYTREKYNQEHDDWLISHNPENHPSGGQADVPYYVPLGKRADPLVEYWPGSRDLGLDLDTINNSRLLPYVPPAFPF